MKNQISRDISEVMRDEMYMKKKILAFLHEGPGTIPEIAAALGHSGSDVVYWVMAMWRYGYLEAEGKADSEGYYKYRLTNKG